MFPAQKVVSASFEPATSEKNTFQPMGICGDHLAASPDIMEAHSSLRLEPSCERSKVSVLLSKYQVEYLPERQISQ